jgi:hypothetical protein
MNLDQVKELVNSSPASMFTKEDVIKLVDKLEVSTPKSDKEYATLYLGFLNNFIRNENLEEAIEVDYDTIGLSIDYDNRVVVDEVNTEIDANVFLRLFKDYIDYKADNEL